MARPVRRRTQLIGMLLACLLAASCASRAAHSAGDGGSAGSGDATRPTTITLYTSVTQQTVDAVIAAYNQKHPNTKVSVFRAATGALNARIATDQRTGGLKADVVWVSDPLTMHGYDSQRLLAEYSPPSAAALPAQYRTASFVGAGLLYLVLIYHKGLTPIPTTWSSLADPAYRGGAVVPDPGFAGSAMGALGYFGEQKTYGIDFYRRLKSNGGAQVKSPEDVITGVAQGNYKLGMTIADSALAAMKKGSPITIAWPSPGAIAIYSPIGVSASSTHRAAAESFEDFVVSKPGQEAIAKTGRQPSLPGVDGIDKPADTTIVSPDWTAFFADEKNLLRSYQEIFGS